jgi:hypothetical protein
MGGRVVRGGLLVALVLGLLAFAAAAAVAQPASGPREAVDQSFSTMRPDSPTGITYTGSYHAAGNAQGDPPYLRRLVFHPPSGTRFDTSVPARCTATDAQLAVMGPEACPPGSRLGSGTAEGLFFVPVTHSFVLDHFQHNSQVLNNADEQILLIQSEGFTVVRGRIRSDGSSEFNPPTCFPAPPAGQQCADDYILQLKSSTVIPPYTRTTAGRVRSYVTTPPTCPAVGHWQTTIQYLWSDGSADSVVSDQPCTTSKTRSPSSKSAHRRHRSTHGAHRRRSSSPQFTG